MAAGGVFFRKFSETMWIFCDVMSREMESMEAEEVSTQSSEQSSGQTSQNAGQAAQSTENAETSQSTGQASQNTESTENTDAAGTADTPGARESEEHKKQYRVTRWIASRAKKKDKREVIELKRLSVLPIHYVFMVAWFIIAAVGSKTFVVVFSYDVYDAVTNELYYSVDRPIAIMFFLACLCFVFFCLFTAKMHSRYFDTNMTSVFEYMLRQDKRIFSFRRREEPEGISSGRLNLLSIEDKTCLDDTRDGSKGDVQIICHKVPHKLMDPRDQVDMKRRRISVSVSEMEEVEIPNQVESRDDPVYLEQNAKIREMLLSDRSQLVAFVGMYIFALFAGVLLGFIV